jgi:large subunit ribosomal protein L19
MALQLSHNENKFGVGDVIRVHQKIQESADKFRTQVFEGTVLGIKGEGLRKTFTVRRIGAQKVGIEQIFPISSPYIEKVEVVREGLKGVRHAKLYYTRDKSTKEIEKIYSRAKRKTEAKKAAAKAKTTKPKTKKKTTAKKATKTAKTSKVSKK